MNWFTNFFAGIAKAFKIEKRPEIENHGSDWDNPYGAKQTFSPMTALSAYAGHAYTHAAVSRIAEDLSALPILLISGRGDQAEQIDYDPVLDLLEMPSTNCDGYLFRQQLTVDLVLSGNCYILLLGLAETPTSIIRLHPDEVEIITNRAGIVGYKHSSNGESVMYEPERIIHIRQASYNKGPKGLYGTGVIQPLAKEINADINSLALTSDSSKKGRPDVLISPKLESDIWGRERRKEILDSYNGMATQGGAMVLSGMVDIQELKLSPRDMEFEASRTMARESISAVCGIPPTELGLPAANFATARQQAISYWETLQKKGRKFEHAFTQIAKLFNPLYSVKFDYSGIEALQAKRDAQLVRIQNHIRNGMNPADAYSYEGLEDAPINSDAIAEEPSEIIDVEDIGDVEQSFLYPFEKKKYEDINFNVPKGVISELKKGLKWHEEGHSGDGLNPDTVGWATRMVNGAKISPDKIKRMRAWLARHETDKEGEGFYPGQKGFPSPGRVAWALWGGDPAVTWSNKIVNQMTEEDEKKSFDLSDINKEENKELRYKIWKIYIERQHGPAERRMQSVMNRYFKGATKRYIRRLKQQTPKKSVNGLTLVRTIIDYSSLLALSQEIAILKRTLGQEWIRVWDREGTSMLKQIGRMGGLDPESIVFGQQDFADVIMDKSIREISKTTGDKVLKIVEDGMLEGLSLDKIAEKISLSPAFNEKRAQTIARTESTRAITGAQLRAFSDAQEVYGLTVKKAWIANQDKDTREAHVLLGENYGDDKDAIGALDNFEVDGFSGIGPGQFGEPSMDINCRCAVVPVVIDSK